MGYLRHVEHDTKFDGHKIDQILSVVTNHSREFDQHLQDWLQHRAEAKIAMQKVGTIESLIVNMAQHLSHLSKLPEIAHNTGALKDGLITHNTALIKQNQTLIEPSQRAQNAVTNIALALILIVGCAIAVMLLRDGQSLSVGGERGLTIKQNINPIEETSK